MKIAFLGTGIMGSRMAENLLHEKHKVTVYNRTPEKADKLYKKGAKPASNPAEAVKDKHIIITMLANPSAVEEVAYGAHGFLQQTPKDSIWINSSTVDPSFVKRMTRETKKRGIHYLDAPVAGSLKPAETGELIFLCGGDKQKFDNIKNLLDTMGKKSLYLGEAGKGSAMKMVFNLLLGQAMAGFSEALSFASAQGLDQNTTLEILSNSPVVAPFIAGKIENLKKGEYPAEFPLQHMIKDLNLASTTAWQNSAFMPIGNLVKELMLLAKNKGYENDDFSSVFEAFTK